MTKTGEAILWRPLPQLPALPTLPDHPSPSFSAGAPSWSGLKRFRLKRLGSQAGYTRLANCSGIHRLDSSSLAISLADGSHHVFLDSESAGEDADPSYDGGQSVFLTEAFRKLFVDTESKAMGKEAAGKEGKLDNAVMRMAGVVGFERGSWVWVHS
jgi:hypothetical protein